jgi:5'-nucleotidase
MSHRPSILITNDDGLFAPGIRELWKALSRIADVTVVAPLVEQSAVGLSITIRNPLKIEAITWSEGAEVWGVSGTPADCVKLGLTIISKKQPDLIVSGINRGSNAGRNLLYSGTVGGAIEGVLHDIPSIAFSCCDFDSPDYKSAAEHIPKFVDYVFKHPLSKGSLLNVSFPLKKHEQIKGFKLTRQGKEFWIENPDKRDHPFENHSYYWLGAQIKEFEEEEDCDISWLRKGYITAVPVHIGELTDHGHLAQQRDHFERSFT